MVRVCGRMAEATYGWVRRDQPSVEKNGSTQSIAGSAAGFEMLEQSKRDMLKKRLLPNSKDLEECQSRQIENSLRGEVALSLFGMT